MRSCWLVAMLVCVGGTNLRADEPDAKPVTVPFELLKTQHMAVNVKINGKGPFRVIFDTGAPVNLINNKVAKQTEVLPKNFTRPLFAPFGSMGQFKIKTLEVGEAKADNLEVIVMDHPTVSLIAKHLGPIEGIVGFSFFGRFRTTIDYEKKVMTFVPTTYRPPDLMKNMMSILMSASQKKVISPAGQWGFRVDKEADDLESGILVKEVLSGSPAAKAGLRVGDRILTLAGRWTDSVGDCYLAASSIAPGTQAVLRILRDGKEMDLTVAVGSGI